MERLISLLILSLTLTYGTCGKRLQWNKISGFNDFGNYYTCLKIDNNKGIDSTATVSVAVGDMNFSFVANITNHHASATKKYSYTRNNKKFHIYSPEYGIMLIGNDNDTILISLSNIIKSHVIENLTVLKINAITATNQERQIIESGVYDIQYPERSFSIRISRTDGNWLVEAGSGDMTEVIRPVIAPIYLKKIGFYCAPGGAIDINQATLHFEDKTNSQMIYTDESEIYQALSMSKGPLSGIWTYADREMDESLLRMGGNYKIAIVDNDDGYNIIYLEGARIKSNLWHPGMLKAILKQTNIPGVFNTEWIDAEFNILNNELPAQIDNEGYLSISFPYQNSKVRFIRIK